MKRIAFALLGAAVLATATAAAASACHGKRHDVRFRTVAYSRHDGDGVFERLRGSGSGFATGSANASGTIDGWKLRDGTFTATLATDWSQATANDHGGSCAPSTGTLSLSDSSSALDSTVKGVTCTVGSNPWNVAAVFFGRTTVTSSTGSVANVSGQGRVLLVEKTDGTVKGFTFAGFRGWHAQALASFTRGDAHHCGWR